MVSISAKEAAELTGLTKNAIFKAIGNTATGGAVST